MDGETFIKLFCLIWAFTGKDSSAKDISKNFDLDSLISNMFANQGSSYPENSQGYPGGQGKPQYQDPSNPLNTMNPGNNPGYPTNGYQHPQFQRPGFMGHPHNGPQGSNPQYLRPGNAMNPGFNYQGRPTQTGYPPQIRPNGIYNNLYPGNNPGYTRPGDYEMRPNQINNPQGNIWNNANENRGMNYPGGSQFFPGNSAQNIQFQRPGFSGNPPNGLPLNYRPRPGIGNDWYSGNPNEKYPDTQVPPGRNWNNPNGYPNNRYPNQISVPGNQFQTQGMDQQNPGLIQGQAIQYPPGDFQNYRPGLQNSDLYNPSQSPNGLNNQLPNLQNTPNFDPTLNNFGVQNALHKNRPEPTITTEKVDILGRPTDITSQLSPHTSPSRMKQCVQDCPSSTDYSPRCGSDNVTYFNEEKVRCARKCGFDVKIVIDGSCPY